MTLNTVTLNTVTLNTQCNSKMHLKVAAKSQLKSTVTDSESLC